jgi:hypothetical protein
MAKDETILLYTLREKDTRHDHEMVEIQLMPLTFSFSFWASRRSDSLRPPSPLCVPSSLPFARPLSLRARPPGRRVNSDRQKTGWHRP